MKTAYVDKKGGIVKVKKGLGEWWIVARGNHRVKSNALPPTKTEGESQRLLDDYAANRNWEIYKGVDLMADEKPSAPCLYKCVKCAWVGTDNQKKRVDSKFCADLGVKGWDWVCPDCGHKEFYYQTTEKV